MLKTTLIVLSYYVFFTTLLYNLSCQMFNNVLFNVTYLTGHMNITHDASRFTASHLNVLYNYIMNMYIIMYSGIPYTENNCR